MSPTLTMTMRWIYVTLETDSRAESVRWACRSVQRLVQLGGCGILLEQLFVQGRTLKHGQRSYNFRGANCRRGPRTEEKYTSNIVCMEKQLLVHGSADVILTAWEQSSSQNRQTARRQHKGRELTVSSFETWCHRPPRCLLSATL
jgi:hypothetical protein